MIPLFLRQLSYIAETNSFAAIARMTGIAYRTVLAMRTGKVSLTSAFKTSIRNAYQRTAYGRLRETGFSASEARRWSWYRPERAVIHELSLKHKIAELTTGAVASKLNALGLPTTKGSVEDLYDEMYEAVKMGIQRSIEPIEVVYDY